MKVADWDTFAARAARLVDASPLATRCVIKYDHAKGSLTMRVTDDATVRWKGGERGDRRCNLPPPSALSVSLTSSLVRQKRAIGPPVRDRPASGREAGRAPCRPVHGGRRDGQPAGGRYGGGRCFLPNGAAAVAFPFLSPQTPYPTQSRRHADGGGDQRRACGGGGAGCGWGWAGRQRGRPRAAAGWQVGEVERELDGARRCCFYLQFVR